MHGFIFHVLFIVHLTLSASAPPPPTHLHLQLVREDPPCVNVSWTPPTIHSKGTKLTGYRITYQVIYPTDLDAVVHTFVKEIDPDELTYQTEPRQLISGATYRFNVSTMGQPSSSDSVHEDITMPEGVPQAPPEFGFTDNGNNSVFFRLGPPPARYRNGRIVEYEIECMGKSRFKTDSPSYVPKTIRMSGEESISALQHFEPNSTYECLAKAHTSKGGGSWSNKIFFTTSTDEYSHVVSPKKVRAFRTAPQEIDVYWEVPQGDEDKIIYFLIYYIPVDRQYTSKEDWERKNTEDRVNSTIIRDLAVGVNYVIRVSSCSTSGAESVWSHAVREESVLDVSDQYNKLPSRLHCPQRQSDSIEVEWMPPKYMNELIHYRVDTYGNYTYWTNRGFPMTRSFPHVTARIPRDDNKRIYTHILEQLHPNVLYTIRVTAVFGANPMDERVAIATNYTLCQTDPEVPNEVLAPTLLKHHDGRVSIKLLRVDEEYGEIYKYHLIAQRISSPSNSYLTARKVVPIQQLLVEDMRKNLDSLFMDGTTSPVEGIPVLVDSFETSSIFPYNRSSYIHTLPTFSRVRQNNSLVLRLFQYDNVQVAVLVCLQFQQQYVGMGGGSSRCKASNWSTPLSLSETAYLSDGAYFSTTNTSSDQLPLLADPVLSVTTIVLVVISACVFVLLLFFFLAVCISRRRQKHSAHREARPFHIFGNNHLQPSNNVKSLTYDEVVPERNSVFRLNNLHSSSGLFRNSFLSKKQASVECYTIPGNGKVASSHTWKNASTTAASPLISPHNREYKADNLLVNYPNKTSSTGSSIESTPLHISRSVVLPNVSPTGAAPLPPCSLAEFSPTMAFMGLSQHNPSCGYHPTLTSPHECLPLLANDHTESLDTGKGSSEVNIFQATIHSPPRAASPIRPSNFRIQPFQSKSSLDRGSPSSQSPMSHSSFPLSYLPDYVHQLFSNDGEMLHKEYCSLERTSAQIILPGTNSSSSASSYVHASLPNNQNKNRYANLIAYDHNRVVLQNPHLNISPNNVISTSSDYINASYIDGYAKPNAYIATQSPLPHSIVDFWHMIWQEGSSLIVMLTSLKERGQSKCELYYPTVRRNQMSFGAYTIHLINELELAYYTVRELQLDKVSYSNLSLMNMSDVLLHPKECESRKVWHLQFTAWPEYGVPSNPLPFLFFHRRVMALRHFTIGSAPTVVHCSAGVGRTGTFIAYDRELQRLQLEECFDVVGCVRHLRSQRNCMVQTEEQYGFLYRMLLEASRFLGKGDVLCKAFDLYVNKLCHSALTSISQSGLSMEFQSLLLALNDSIISLTSNVGSNWGQSMEYNTAVLPINMHKNRGDASLPLENNRVILQAIRGVECSDYINASYIDGYRMKRAYIVTQHPLAHTIDDFWRMVWEQNCQIMVMLSLMSECQKEQLPQYWPSASEAPLRTQNLFVEAQAEYQMTHYMLREFQVTDTSSAQTRTVRQFHCQMWPGHLRDMNGLSSVLELVLQTHRTRDQFGFTEPIVVHCNLASDRCGLFLALSLMTERALYENVVDVLRTVQLLSMQRPNLFRSEAAYELCYLLMLQYLSSKDN